MRFSAPVISFGFTLLCIVFGTSVARCKMQRRFRALPPEASRYTSKKIDAYESSRAKRLFDDEKQRYACLARKFKGALEAEDHPKFEHDPRLDGVAWIYAYAFGRHDTTPATGLIDWSISKLGVAGRLEDRSVVWAYGNTARERLDGRIVDFVRRLEIRGDGYSFGVARTKVDTKKYAQAVIVVEKAVTIRDLKKHYSPGEEILLRGRITIPGEQTDLYMDATDLEVVEVSLDTDDSGWFLARLPAPREPGRHFLQIQTSPKPIERTTVLNVPIYVGVEEPPQPDPILLEPPPNPPPESDWGAALFDLYNREREKVGLSPLEADDRLAEISRATARRRADRYYLPETSLWAKLRRAGIPRNHSYQGTGSFEYMAESVWRRLLKPSSREKFFDERHSRGLAAVSDFDWMDRERFAYVMQAYEPLPEDRRLPPETARRLAEGAATSYQDPPLSARSESAAGLAIEEKLRGLGARPIRHEPDLDLLAELYAARGRLKDPLGLEVLWKLGLTGDVRYRYRRLTRSADVSPYLAEEVRCFAEGDEGDPDPRLSFGRALSEVEPGIMLQTVVFVQRKVEFDPLPKRLEPGEKLEIAGRFLVETNDPLLHHFAEDGSVRSVEIEPKSSGRFRVEVAFPREPGRYLVELTSAYDEIDLDSRTLERSLEQIAVLSFHVGVDEPRGIDEIVVDPAINPRNEADWSGLILELLNQARAEAGRPPLRWNALAHALGTDLIRQRMESFDDPGFGDLAHAFSEDGAGEILTGHWSYSSNLEARFRRKLLRPSFLAALNDEGTDSVAVAYDYDRDSCYLLLADAEQERYEAAAPEPPPEAYSGRLGGVNDRRGSLGDESRRLIEKCLPEVRRCYRNEGLDFNDELSGSIDFDLAIGSEGRVLAVVPVEIGLRDWDVATCVAGAVRERSLFPAYEGGPRYRKVRFDFEPADGKGEVSLR